MRRAGSQPTSPGCLSLWDIKNEGRSGHLSLRPRRPGPQGRALRLLDDVLKFSPQFTSSVLFDQVINLAQTCVSDRLRLIGYGCLPKSPQTSEHPRAPADCPPVGWRLRAPHYGALTIGRPRSANDLQRCLPLCGQSRHSFPQPTNLNYQQEAWAWGIVVEITAALLGGFACGYVVRELVSRQRRAAEKRRYLERQAVAKRQLLQKKILARQVTVKELATAAGARTHNIG
jgi:hypothetical protein